MLHRNRWKDDLLTKLKKSVKNNLVMYKCLEPIIRQRKIIKYKEKYKNIDDSVLKYDIHNMPIFKQIEIETVNRCNGKCNFCPVNANQPQRPYAKMSEELFRKIIEELKELDYKGRVCFSSNNEPLLDNRITEGWIEYARKELPNAFLFMWTNGTLLRVQMIDKLINNLDTLHVDCYSDGETEYPGQNIKNIIEYIEKEMPGKRLYGIYKCNKKTTMLPTKIKFFKRNIYEILTSRGGQAPNKKECVIPEVKCLRPFEHMIIRPDGKVSLCCNDALGKYTIGDVNKDSLIDIWKNSLIYFEVRQSLQQGSRKDISLCDKCDFTE